MAKTPPAPAAPSGVKPAKVTNPTAPFIPATATDTTVPVPSPGSVSNTREATTEEVSALPMQYREVTIDLNAIATRKKDDPRIPISFSSEVPCERYYGLEILGHKSTEVDLSRAKDGLPFCQSHDQKNQVGLVEDVYIGDDKRLYGMIRFGSHPNAEWVQQDIVDGIRRNVSVGYIVNSMTLSGTKKGVDSYRITNWTPVEVSTVAVPADPTVGVGRDSDRAEFPVLVHLPKSHSPPATRAMERSMPEVAAVADAPVAETARAGKAAKPAKTKEEIRAKEQKRMEKKVKKAANRQAVILEAVREHGLDIGVAQDFFKRGLKPKAARAEILTLKRADGTTGVVRVSGVHDRAGDKPFEDMGDFLATVIRAAKPHTSLDPRLATRASGLSEGTPMDGGFAIPPQFAASIMQNLWNTGSVASKVNRIPISSNQLRVNVIKEDSRVDGSRYGGAQAFFVGEGVTGTAKKPQLRQIELNLGKLMGLWYLTDELMVDAPALNALWQTAFQQEITFKTEDAFINGKGAGTPLGILNSGAVVQIAIEATQTIANTPTFIVKNAAKMYAAMPASLVNNACWFIGQDVWPHLITATVGGTNAVVPVFMPPGMMSSAPYGSLYGRPIYPVEYCAAVGTPGDIIFANMGQYLAADRGGPMIAQSIHVQFLTDETTFRIVYRIDGQPVWNTSLTPFKSAQAQSPYITLGARA